MQLSITQTQALDYLEDQLTNEVLFGGGAGGGKSALICYFGLKQSIKYPGSRGLLGRAILKTLRETTLNTFFQVAKMQGVQHTYKYISPSLIRFKNGSEILLKDLFAYPSDPEFDELGSLELTWAGVDEANQITTKAKSILRSRIRYRLDEFGLKPKLAMACNPAKNWVKSDFFTPHVRGTLKKNRKFVQSLLWDNPYIDSSYEGSLQELDTASKERLLMGNWDYSADPSSLMSAEGIEGIFENSFVKITGKRYITADIARMGSDKTVIRVWDGWRVLSRSVLSKEKTTTTVTKIRELQDKYQIPASRILCDEDGVGGGVVDSLRCKGFVANSRPFQHDPNNVNYDMLKSQCAWHLAKMVNSGQVYEDADPNTRELLEEELEQIKQKNIDKDGKRSLQSKDLQKMVLGRSPDDADTYIMRAWFDLAIIEGYSIVSGAEKRTTNRRTI